MIQKSQFSIRFQTFVLRLKKNYFVIPYNRHGRAFERAIIMFITWWDRFSGLAERRRCPWVKRQPGWDPFDNSTALFGHSDFRHSDGYGETWRNDHGSRYPLPDDGGTTETLRGGRCRLWNEFTTRTDVAHIGFTVGSIWYEIKVDVNIVYFRLLGISYDNIYVEWFVRLLDKINWVPSSVTCTRTHIVCPVCNLN